MPYTTLARLGGSDLFLLPTAEQLLIIKVHRMLLGLTRLLDALRGDSRAEQLALMEAHGVATP